MVNVRLHFTSICNNQFLPNISLNIFFAGEAAIQLGRKTYLIKKTVEWCNVEDHSGVQGEANRLIAWLITNNRSLYFSNLLYSSLYSLLTWRTTFA